VILPDKVPVRPDRPFWCSIFEIKLSKASDSMSDGRKVFCVKLQKELPGLDEPPFDTDLGKKIYENVSRDAWNMWMEHCKMLLNEYRLNPARKEDQQVIVNQLEQYFFGEGAALPKEYVPPSH
jgi:Fe-S cluster biosynthesis and repair protein YggX